MDPVKGKFSVILPYYNGSKFIQEAVDSILAQTYTEFELLLIDDGSPDKAEADFLAGLVTAKKDGRIKYYRKNNGGLSETRNFGIDHSDGEFIAFIDQDDLWDRDKLSLQADIFRMGESVKFICTDAKIIGEKTEEMRIGEKWRFKDGMIPGTFSQLLKGSFVACSSVAFRRFVINGAGYSNRAYVVVPDYEYFLRLSEKMDFYFIARSLVSYRLHEGNTTKQRLKGACEVISVLFDRPPLNILDRVAITIHFFRCLALILWLWLNKVLRK